MRENMLSERKMKDERTARILKTIGATAVIAMTVFCMNVFAADGGAMP